MKIYLRDLKTYISFVIEILTNSLMLQKAIYLNEYTDGWERFNETSLTKKKEFYSKVSMESFTDADYKHAKRVWENFGIQNLSQYHKLSDTILFSDTLKSFKNKCIKSFEQHPTNFFSEPGLASRDVSRKQRWN